MQRTVAAASRAAGVAVVTVIVRGRTNDGAVTGTTAERTGAVRAALPGTTGPMGETATGVAETGTAIGGTAGIVPVPATGVGEATGAGRPVPAVVAMTTARSGVAARRPGGVVTGQVRPVAADGTATAIVGTAPDADPRATRGDTAATRGRDGAPGGTAPRTVMGAARPGSAVGYGRRTVPADPGTGGPAGTGAGR